MTLKLENMTEREILIQQAGVLDKLCVSLKSLSDSLKTLTDDNKSEHKDIKGSITDVSKGKVSNWLFFPIITLMVIMIIGLTAYAGKLKNEVVKNTTCIERLEKD